MERGSRILVFLAIFAGLYFFFGRKDESSSERRVEEPALVLPSGARPEPALCDVWTKKFRSRVSSRGGVLVSHEPLTAKYRKHGKPLELVTTPDHPHLGPWYTSFRSAAQPQAIQDWLVPTDVLDFEITVDSGDSCEMKYEDDKVLVKKVVAAGKTPYALHVSTEITNKSSQAGTYALSMGTSSYLIDDEVSSKMFRMNPRMTHVECVTDSGTIWREGLDDFAADDFDDAERFPRSDLNSGQWSQPTGQGVLAAVSNAYFTDAIAHLDGPAAPVCLLQIDRRWHVGQYAGPSDDPESGAIYKSRLAYAPRSLAAGATERFDFQAFVGPKERKALAAAGSEFDSLIDLGFFSIIAKVLVSYLLWLYEIVPSWGLAIVLLTITTRTLLFPLTWPSIKNMVQMRELKPEMDRLNQKYKDDAQAKGLAQMELWKKHGVNPMKGCLPQLVSMPVWFALYTTLQSAVELYNIPFLWFPDLSEADPYYILPFVIGAVFFLQQKLMPMQADPAQQKMMMYFMPIMFTVFMLFLPAGLGVYMFTNSLLGIVQQQVVEQHAKHTLEERKNRVEVMDTPGAKKKKKRRGS